MSKISQQKGKAGEEMAVWYLKSIGAKCIEKISTPMINVKGKAVYCKQSSIDYLALLFFGPETGYRACRIEVKQCDSDRLHHSRLRPHQIKWLLDWNNYNNYSFVLWVHKTECFLFRYPNHKFTKGHSLSVEDAKKVSLQ